MTDNMDAGTGPRKKESTGERGRSGWERVWTEGAAEQSGPGQAKLFLLVRYVSEYGRFYRRRSGSQTGHGTSDPFWDVQYTK